MVGLHKGENMVEGRTYDVKYCSTPTSYKNEKQCWKQKTRNQDINFHLTKINTPPNAEKRT